MTQVDFKIILLGSQGVGKTSIFMRYVYSTYMDMPHKTTLGAVFGSKNVESKGNKFSIGVWDTAGSERYYSMTQLYYRNAKAAVVCYDPFSKESWERVIFWIEELNKKEEDCKIYVCQTKKDLLVQGRTKPLVDRHDVMDYVESISGTFITVSSKTGENIDELFQQIVDDLSSDAKCLRQLRAERKRQQQQASLSCYKSLFSGCHSGSGSHCCAGAMKD